MATYGYIRTSRDREGEEHLVQTSVFRGTSGTCPLMMRDSSRYPDFLTLSSRPVAMADSTCRSFDRAAYVGGYCIPCAADFVTKALNPFCGDGTRNFLQDSGSLRPEFAVSTEELRYSRNWLLEPEQK